MDKIEVHNEIKQICVVKFQSYIDWVNSMGFHNGPYKLYESDPLKRFKIGFSIFSQRFLLRFFFTFLMKKQRN